MVGKESFSCKLPNQTGCHFTVRLWSVLDFMSLFLRRKMEQFSLLQNRAPYISTHTGCLEDSICLFADMLARVKAKKRHHVFSLNVQSKLIEDLDTHAEGERDGDEEKEEGESGQDVGAQASVVSFSWKICQIISSGCIWWLFYLFEFLALDWLLEVFHVTVAIFLVKLCCRRNLSVCLSLCCNWGNGANSSKPKKKKRLSS